MTISAYYSWAKCSILWPVKFMRNTLKKERISFYYHKILNHLIRMTKKSFNEHLFYEILFGIICNDKKRNESTPSSVYMFCVRSNFAFVYSENSLKMHR